MGNINNIIDELDDHYFWDVDTSDLDPYASKRLIIERVFCLGDIEDIRLIIRYYGYADVVEQLADAAYLDPKTLNFVSILFDKPKNEFRCSTPKPLPMQSLNS